MIENDEKHTLAHHNKNAALFLSMTDDAKLDIIENYLSDCSGNIVTAAISDNEQGVFVHNPQKQRLLMGTNIMNCDAARMALDPPFRETHCGFCTTTKPSQIKVCDKCQLIAFCLFCKERELKHHQKECLALQSIQKKFGCNIDSSHLLTIRLLCCHDEDWWDLFSCLYELPLPRDCDSIISAVCSQLPSKLDDKFLYKKILARVMGCSHAITDVSLSLGQQTLGRVVFLHQSFYNHSCTPNAFLSCCVLTTRSSGDDIKCNRLTARVHLVKDVQGGEPITLSYIPLSGLAIQERHDRLQAGYGFQCTCEECLNPRVKLPMNADVGSIREIQYSCNEQLLLAKRNLPRWDDEIENALDGKYHLARKQ